MSKDLNFCRHIFIARMHNLALAARFYAAGCTIFLPATGRSSHLKQGSASLLTANTCMGHRETHRTSLIAAAAE